MEKRVLLAITLSFLVLAAYQYFFVKPLPRTARTTAAADAPAQPGPGRSSRASIGPAGPVSVKDCVWAFI